MPEIKSEKQRGFFFSYFPKERARRYAHETPGGIKDKDLPRKLERDSIPKSEYGKKYPEKVGSYKLIKAAVSTVGNRPYKKPKGTVEVAASGATGLQLKGGY